MSRKSERSDFKSLTVVQSEEERIPSSVLATEIRAIAEGVRSLQQSGLTDEAITLLVWGAIPESYRISKKTVRR